MMRSSLAALVAISLIACTAATEEEGASSNAISMESSGTAYVATVNVNLRERPSLSAPVVAVIPEGSRILASGKGSANGFHGVVWNGTTGWAYASLLEAQAGSKESPVATEDEESPSPDSFQISSAGRAQMSAVVAHASSHNSRPQCSQPYCGSNGDCFNYVWGYLTRSGYGKLRNWSDAPDMQSDWARHFADYMNVKANADRWGLQRLPLDNPYDAPRGAVVVVAPGSPGTSHRYAGDISIATGGPDFINDGPKMSYGGSAAAFRNGGRVLGIFVPK